MAEKKEPLESLTISFASPLKLLMAVVGLLLVLACTNVAGLLLSRRWYDRIGRRRRWGLLWPLVVRMATAGGVVTMPLFLGGDAMRCECRRT